MKGFHAMQISFQETCKNDQTLLSLREVAFNTDAKLISEFIHHIIFSTSILLFKIWTSLRPDEASRLLPIGILSTHII